jgi:hypothetical protein
MDGVQAGVCEGVGDLVEKWSKVALEYLDALPIDKAEIKSSDLRKAIGAQSLSRPTWKRNRGCHRMFHVP